ncbi:trans-AT polyketide synthase, acyltransferase and oxidoreductase domain-containing protein [Tistlia consotensis]|uniref:Trans-AT polyketide synthase, acyltransferase and oxidoreductase domain-containing protein n=1 Tax=Tistlia consotensis USBA 355 TaxID=560819 RepID=A0A1Y6CJ36_9PROT|nr:PfaD family polyunsaturated fatty acid/polyketide biosynthesis protein [Tistlia consotensis]SMF69182.1 trans-AT polyketide synthase, acyltransferase and oxidoreductase domain-containing protein [Tistlia consotensis USBA 355]SNS01898.1 trans-AT polyketide synthase, acyltransferase and oxidoreductase domain-containing protein [Tistlia consotensis]
MITVDSLGSSAFKREHGLRYAYVQGSMVRGIASARMVVAMGRAGFLGFLGTGARSVEAVESAILEIKAGLAEGQPWGVNLLANAATPQAEMAAVDLLLRHDVPRIEASAYLQVTAPLVKYRAKGLRRGPGGRILFDRLVMAKLSRPEVAAQFLAPAPERLVAALLADGAITAEEAELVRAVPMADDLCVEADSGGHTDRGSLPSLLPPMLQLRDELAARHGHPKPVRIGAAGGIGTPAAAAAAFVLGADFVLTGSINQCTVEADTSEAVKDLLQQIDVQDTGHCPSGSLFELGAEIQVVKKGLFFPARASKLYDLWRLHGSLDEIDARTRRQIQEKYFRRSFEAVWDETRSFYAEVAPEEIARAEANPKHKMALIFRWYFVHSMRLAEQGDTEQKVDYQIHCGPALGAFNHWVKGSGLEDWRKRHVAEIALRLMEATAALLEERFAALSAPAPAAAASDA